MSKCIHFLTFNVCFWVYVKGKYKKKIVARNSLVNEFCFCCLVILCQFFFFSNCLNFALYMISVEGILVQYFVSIIFFSVHLLMGAHSFTGWMSVPWTACYRTFLHFSAFFLLICFYFFFVNFVCISRVRAIQCANTAWANTMNEKKIQMPVNDRDKQKKEDLIRWFMTHTNDEHREPFSNFWMFPFQLLRSYSLLISLWVFLFFFVIVANGRRNARERMNSECVSVCHIAFF